MILRGNVLNFIEKLIEKCDIKRKLLCFFLNYCAAVSKKFWALKKEEVVNLTIFVLFSFFKSSNIRGTSSKYFQNKIWKTDISSVTQQ